jgi:hypothetical protein
MLAWCRQTVLAWAAAMLVFARTALADAPDKFGRCKILIESIMDGTPYGDINNITIEKYIYRGHVHGMNVDFERNHRDSFLTITTEGKHSPVPLFGHESKTNMHRL